MKQKLVVLELILLAWLLYDNQLGAQSSQEVPCPPQPPQTYCVLLKDGFLGPFAVSPDGRFLATLMNKAWGSWEGTIIILQLPQGVLLHEVPHGWPFVSIAFSSDSKLLAAGTLDGKIKLWDMTTGKEVRTIDTQAFIPVGALAFSPDGRWLASSTCERRDLKVTCEQPDVGKINLWEVATGKLLRVISSSHQGEVMKLAFSPDSKVLAVAWEKAVVDVWEIETGRRGFSINNAIPMPFFAVAFSPDGQLLATDYCLKFAGYRNCGQAEVRLWYAKDGDFVRTLPGITPYNGNVNSISFSPTGKLLAAGMFQNVKIWEVTSGAELRTIPAKVVDSVAFIPPEGRWLAYVDFEINSGDTIKLYYIGDLTGTSSNTAIWHRRYITPMP